MDFLDIHSHKSAQKHDETSIQSLSLTSDIFLAMPKTRPISIGLHPWYAILENLEMQLKYLSVLAKQPNVKLIGECGLDKLKGESLDNQIIIFEKQIAIAEHLQKPIIIHCVKAFAELIEMKEQLKVKVPMIIHGFNKSEEMGKQLLGKGFLLSFGASLLKPNSGVTNLIQQIDDFFLETDDSEVPIKEVYLAAANLKKCAVDDLKARIFCQLEPHYQSGF
ncbi:TatD family hydrolase [Pedobacter endophyticus]|uniref:TatD family hydrolase n=1 Tax=Pedobacter endophyticus TaxID=2789740 RepID=A0A7U3Q4G0_9SPHI|nr:TatD family hydrolase [Pedobacter endophyticus]QPH38431.1 TatD family hydrolase [Pedobacter endophyticus]